MNEKNFQPIRFLNYLKHRADHLEVPLALDEGFIMDPFMLGLGIFWSYY